MQQQTPIIVHVVDQPTEDTSLSDVLVGSLGLTGALLLLALVMGLLLGGLLIGLKRLRERNQPVKDPGADIHISPYA